MKSLKLLYQEHEGKVSDKWQIYLDVYDRVLNEYREQPVSMLEIGIQNGGSLELWAKYFESANVLVGCDIDEKCNQLSYTDERIHLIVDDANSAQAEKRILGITGSLDIVLDDGSHTSADIVKAFAKYFPYIKDGGVFIAEDLHCSYWKDWQGGVFHPLSSISFFKLLADVINHEHWGVDQSTRDLLEAFSKEYGVSFDESVLAHIHSIEFVNSLCIVRKKPAQKNILGKRVCAGTEAQVVSEMLDLVDHKMGFIDQRNNKWSVAPFTQPGFPVNLIESEQYLQKKDDELEQLQAQNERELEQLRVQKDEEAQQLREGLTDIHNQIHALRTSTCWRVTRPLRGVMFVLKNLRHLIAIARIVLSSYGVKGVFRKVLSIYKAQGCSGLLARLRGNQTTHVMQAMQARTDYASWVEQFDTWDSARIGHLQEALASLPRQPLISVVMPTYNPNPVWLREAIDSVIDQVYQNWELCIADDASTDPEVVKVLREYASKDSRIKITIREQNGHISRATNSALELVTGEWIALLDHDDLLPVQALVRVAQTISENPHAQLIYSDEDKIDEQGVRQGPYFKTDWNPDLFLSHNMITHLGVYKTSLIRSIDGFRTGVEGAQDYDLALRCIEKIKPKQIIHIPEILYHWRIHAESTAGNADDAKPYAMLAGEKALNEHLDRMNINAKAELIGHGFRVRYALPENDPMVSLIIPTKNAHGLVKQCVESILNLTTYTNYEIIIVDNGSDDTESLAYFSELSHHPKIRVHRDDGPFNYSALNNRAAEIANGEYLGLVNNDIEVISPDWLSEMLSHAARPGVGAVGAKLLYPDDTIQHAGVVLGIGGWAGHSHKHRPHDDLGYCGRTSLVSNFAAVTAACLLVSKAKFMQVGMLNEEHLKVACNDVELCLKLLDAGYLNVWTPYAVLYHHESATRGYEDNPEKKARFKKELSYMREHWGELLAKDPFYSPNLTLSDEQFNYAFPPRV